MSAVPPPTSAAEHRRGWLFLAAVAYLAFVVYGSLVPLDFRPRPLAEAWDAFLRIRYLRLGIASRADWVANILLFVPLTFLWLGAVWPARSRPLQAVASIGVLACSIALCVGIEFTQLFFPPRTVSLNDIYAECIGAVIGIAAWWIFGARLTAWLSDWLRARTRKDVTERLLYGYLFVLFGYNVLPLDLTISPVELFHKWREGKVLLIPFSAPFPSIAQRAYDLLTDVAIWVPAAFLWRASSLRTARAAMVRVVSAATLLELLQLFVYSRVTDVTDIIAATIGGLIGVSLGGVAVARRNPRRVERTVGLVHYWAAFVWLAGLLAIVAILCVVFWYPFDFRSDWGFVRERIATLRRVPLSAYYYGTEFRAVTEVLHKVGFFLPLGAWFAWGASRIRERYRTPPWLLHAISIGFVASIAAGIETGQVFLPRKIADPTDFVLEMIGGVAGYLGFGLLARRWHPGSVAAGRDLSGRTQLRR